MLLTLVLSALTSACFAHRAIIFVDPAGDSGNLSSPERIQLAVGAVERSSEAMGLVPDTRMEYVGPDSRNSPEIRHIVIGLFKTAPDSDEWIEVRLVVEKETGYLRVLVKRPNGPYESELSRAIESRVVRDLQEVFPSDKIHIESGIAGPSLGP